MVGFIPYLVHVSVTIYMSSLFYETDAESAPCFWTAIVHSEVRSSCWSSDAGKIYFWHGFLTVLLRQGAGLTIKNITNYRNSIVVTVRLTRFMMLGILKNVVIVTVQLTKFVIPSIFSIETMDFNKN